jgi:hypothetical protein
MTEASLVLEESAIARNIRAKVGIIYTYMREV